MGYVIMLKLAPVFNVEITCDYNVIGCWKFLAIKLMKPKESAECHQTRVESEDKTTE